MPNHTFQVVVTEEQQKCIADSVKDWKSWCERAAQYAVDHKAERCRDRLLDREEHLLGDTIPKDKNARAVAILSNPAHKDRNAREAG